MSTPTTTNDPFPQLTAAIIAADYRPAALRCQNLKLDYALPEEIAVWAIQVQHPALELEPDDAKAAMQIFYDAAASHFNAVLPVEKKVELAREGWLPSKTTEWSTAIPEVIQVQQARMGHWQRIVEDMQQRLRWLTDLMARKDLKVGTRAALRGLLLEIERVPLDERTAQPDRWYEVRVSKIATENGTTPGTISKALSRLEEIGLLEKQTLTTHDPEQGITRSTVYARLHVDITDLSAVPPIPKKETAPRPRCTTCGTYNLVSLAYACENGHVSAAEEARGEASFPTENTVAAAPPPEWIDQASFPMENTPPGEVGSAVPAAVFFEPRAFPEAEKSYGDRTPSLRDRSAPALPTESTPAQGAPAYGPGFVDALIERLRRRNPGADPHPT